VGYILPKEEYYWDGAEVRGGRRKEDVAREIGNVSFILRKKK
jgi:hypothetical protein